MIQRIFIILPKQIATKRTPSTHPENVVPKSTPTINRSVIGGCSLTGSLTGPLIASVELGGV